MIMFQIDSQRFHIASFPYSSKFVQKIKKINWKKWYIQKIFKNKNIKKTGVSYRKIKKYIGINENNLIDLKFNKEGLEC